MDSKLQFFAPEQFWKCFKLWGQPVNVREQQVGEMSYLFQLITMARKLWRYFKSWESVLYLYCLGRWSVYPLNLDRRSSFDPSEWLASNFFFLQYHPWIAHEGHENKGNDHQPRKLLIVKQTVFVSIEGNVKWKDFSLWCKGAKASKSFQR